MEIAKKISNNFRIRQDQMRLKCTALIPSRYLEMRWANPKEITKELVEPIAKLFYKYRLNADHIPKYWGKVDIGHTRECKKSVQ